MERRNERRDDLPNAVLDAMLELRLRASRLPADAGRLLFAACAYGLRLSTYVGEDVPGANVSAPRDWFGNRRLDDFLWLSGAGCRAGADLPAVSEQNRGAGGWAL